MRIRYLIYEKCTKKKTLTLPCRNDRLIIDDTGNYTFDEVTVWRKTREGLN